MASRPTDHRRQRRRVLAGAFAGLVGAVAAGLAAAPAGAQSPPGPSAQPNRSAPMASPVPTAPASAICLGRFSFTLPTGWSAAGREQMIYRSRVTDDFRPFKTLPGVTAQGRVLRGELPAADPLLREFNVDGVGPGAWFGLGNAGSPSKHVVLLAGSPESGVRLEALASTGKEAQAQEGLRQLAAGYRPGARTGFCLPQGAFAVDPGRNESTRLAARNAQLPGAELRFSTVATSAPRADGPLADPAADAQAMAGSGTTLKPLGQTERRVAGLTGRDARAVLQEPGKPPTLIYRFFFPGIALNAAAPEIIIALDGPNNQQAALDAAWNQLLDSVQPVPLR